jgi:hypothetical protein
MMSENCRDCSKSNTDNPTLRASVDSRTRVRGAIRPGFTAELNIRILPGLEFNFDYPRNEYQPFSRAYRRSGNPMELSADLKKKLRESNKEVVQWLTSSDQNPKEFLANPVKALLAAGVQLSRVEQKALMRIRQAGVLNSVVPPGAEISTFTVTAASRFVGHRDRTIRKRDARPDR